MELRKIILSIFFLYSLFFIIGSILAPVTAHFGLYDISAKLTSTYMFSCHQQPVKSFWILGYPIALCTRCLGFYTGVAFSSFLKIIGKMNITLKAFIIIFIITITDIFINYILKHSTGIYIRFIIGTLMGTIFTIIINYIFTINKKENIKC